MLGTLRRRGWSLLDLFPALLARLGLVSPEKGRETFELAVPAMVTAAIWTLLRITDFFMVSYALSDAAVAALEIAFQYYFVGFSLAIAISGGTISLVSRFKGAGDHASADFVIKQSLWFALIISLPLTVVSWPYAGALVGILTHNEAVIELGGTYLRIVMLSMGFLFWTMIGERGLEGSGDTRTPMYIEFVIFPVNVVANALLIFGLGPFPRLGIAGAAWGTVIANTVMAVIYAAIYRSGRFSIRLRLAGKQWDTDIGKEIIRVGLPLAGTRLAATLGRFPFLFVLGVLGAPVLAAFAIGRQLVQLAMIPAWGFATSASTLVGQSLGNEAEEEAAAYGWETLTVALSTQLIVAGVLGILSRPIALLFQTGSVELTVVFIRVFALSVAGSSVAQTLQGGLRGAGDTTWPLYGTILGTVLRISIAILALPAAFVFSVGGTSVPLGLDLGVAAIFVAILADVYVRGAVIAVRFWSGRWQYIARRPTSDEQA